jgi:hypothetical protein
MRRQRGSDRSRFILICIKTVNENPFLASKLPYFYLLNVMSLSRGYPVCNFWIFIRVYGSYMTSEVNSLIVLDKTFV